MAKMERELERAEHGDDGLDSAAYQAVHRIKQFILGRHTRYGKKKGGL